MNDENLKRPTPKEAREKGKRGGIASGKARRGKKQMRELAVEMLAAFLSPDMAKKLKPFDVAENETTYNAAIVAKQIAKALQGDVNSAKFLQDLAGQNSVQKTEATVKGPGLTFNLATMSREEVEKAQEERDRANGEHLDSL